MKTVEIRTEERENHEKRENSHPGAWKTTKNVKIHTLEREKRENVKIHTLEREKRENVKIHTLEREKRENVKIHTLEREKREKRENSHPGA